MRVGRLMMGAFAAALAVLLATMSASAQSSSESPRTDPPQINSIAPQQPSAQQPVPPQAPSSALGIIAPGRFQALGVNPDGSSYSADVVIRREGDVWRVSWLISSGQTFSGVGRVAGNRLVVDWGQAHPVIYEPGPGGTLAGIWANGRGKETLVPMP